MGPTPDGNTGVILFNGTNGATVSSSDLHPPFGYSNVPMNIQLDESDGALYAWNLAGGNDDGLYKIDVMTGMSTLVVAAPDIIDIIDSVSAYDSKAHRYVFVGGKETGPDSLYAVDTTQHGAGALKALPTSFNPDDLDFITWDSSVDNQLVTFNFTTGEFVTVDSVTGKSAILSKLKTSIPGIPSDEAVVYDAANRQLYVVFVNPTPNPSRYEVATADLATGNVTHIADTLGNTDFAYLFLYKP